MKDYFKLAHHSLLQKLSIKSFINNKPFPLTDNQIGLLKSQKVYNFLKNFYGEPNGYQEIDNKKIKAWEWIFKTDNGLIVCYGYDKNWLIAYKGKLNKNLEKDALKFFDEIIEKVFKKNLKRIKDKYEVSFGIIDNPFCFYQDIIFILEENILSNYSNKKIDQLDKEKEIDPQKNKSYILYLIFINYLILFEAFLNLVLFFFLKQDFRKDERLRLNIENEKVDIKLKMLNHYCFCFKDKPFIDQDELYRAYMYLIGLRNSFIHANIVDFKNIALKKNKNFRFGEAPCLLTSSKNKNLALQEPSNFYYRKNYKLFLSSPSIDKIKYGIPNNPKTLNEKAIQNTKIIINSLIFRIIESMENQYKYRFGLVYDWQTIQYKIDKNNIYLTSVISKNNNRFDLYISEKEIEKELAKLNKFETIIENAK